MNRGLGHYMHWDKWTCILCLKMKMLTITHRFTQPIFMFCSSLRKSQVSTNLVVQSESSKGNASVGSLQNEVCTTRKSWAAELNYVTNLLLLTLKLTWLMCGRCKQLTPDRTSILRGGVAWLNKQKQAWLNQSCWGNIKNIFLIKDLSREACQWSKLPQIHHW